MSQRSSLYSLDIVNLDDMVTIVNLGGVMSQKSSLHSLDIGNLDDMVNIVNLEDVFLKSHHPTHLT